MHKTVGVLCALLCSVAAASAVDFASLQPQGYINDYSGVIDSPTRAALEQYCTRVEALTGAQIAVITINTLAGEPLEDVANDIFNKWGIGKKGKDEGILLLLVTQDRRMRLEVGYGLEPVIPDGFAGSVLRAMAPSLKQSRYGEAVTEGLNVIGTRIAQAKGVNIDAPLPRRSGRRQPTSPMPMILFGAVALLWLLAAAGRGRRGMHRGSGGDLLTGMILGNLLGRGHGSGRGGGGFGGFSSGGGFGGFGGFGGGSSGGGGASGSW